MYHNNRTYEGYDIIIAVIKLLSSNGFNPYYNDYYDDDKDCRPTNDYNDTIIMVIRCS